MSRQLGLDAFVFESFESTDSQVVHVFMESAMRRKDSSKDVSTRGAPHKHFLARNVHLTNVCGHGVHLEVLFSARKPTLSWSGQHIMYIGHGGTRTSRRQPVNMQKTLVLTDFQWFAVETSGWSCTSIHAGTWMHVCRALNRTVAEAVYWGAKM